MAMYCSAMDAGEKGLYSIAVANFNTLGAFRDSALLSVYYAALSYEATEEYETAQQLLLNMTGYRDAAVRITSYPEKICARDYKAADAAEQRNELETALKGFIALGSYSDSAARAAQVQEKIRARDYKAADAAETKGDYAAAYAGFTALGDYLDSMDRAARLQDKGRYAQAMSDAMNGRYKEAYALFAALAEKGYEDSAEKAYILGISDFAEMENKGKGTAAFRFHGLWGIINIPTNTSVSSLWESIGSFNAHGLAPVTKDGHWGYIDRQGGQIIPCEWREVSAFAGDLCTVANDDRLFGLMNRDGSVVSEAQWKALGNSCYDEYYRSVRCCAPVFSDGKIKVQTKDGLWGFIDEQGSPVGEAVWEEIFDFSEDLAAVRQNGKYGFIDGSGAVIIAPAYDEVQSFHEGLAAVRKGNYWQYIDRDGSTVIQPKYTSACDFSGGKADVYLPGIGWQIIDKTGSLLYFINSRTAADYSTAVGLMEAGRYPEAREIFLTLSGYKDADARAEECAARKNEADYSAAAELLAAGEYEKAKAAFAALGSYSNSADMVKETDYQKALGLVNEQKYEEALALFDLIPGYKDVDTLLKENAGLQNVIWSPGHYVFFGSYEQDNDTENGKEPIEWLVLDKTEDTVLLISRYGLDVEPYHNQDKEITWEQCSLRSWLNKDFLNTAFSREEQERIQTADVDNGKTQSPQSSTKGERNTKDKVFLLSCSEAGKYFNSDQERVCIPTTYAKAQGAYTHKTGACWWWLRSHGSAQGRASVVDYGGTVSERGNRFVYAYECVRPVIWVKVEP